MCDFCNDLRNIEPASYLGSGDAEFQEWIKEKSIHYVSQYR
jgi:hypothetical protein